jgi:hypothetical protein
MLARLQSDPVGTVPIGINVAGSDLDIICEVQDFDRFELIVIDYFKDYHEFSVVRRQVEGNERIKINFTIEEWQIEIFGQSKPTTEQNGYIHMVIEDRMLSMYGDVFKDEIIRLKSEGLKTEPAFAKALKLLGDPYQRLLEIYNWNDVEIRKLWGHSNVKGNDVVNTSTLGETNAKNNKRE